MNYAAIWHEAIQRYCYCLEPGRFLFRLQTAKYDIKSVTLHTLDKYLPLKIRDTRKTSPMNYSFYRAVLDYAAEGTLTASGFLGVMVSSA